MNLLSCQDFGCKNKEFSVETSHGEVEPNVVACYPSNIFAKMMAAQNKVQLPPKPKDKDNWTGPQKLYSDLIDWASPFDQGWTIDVIETGNTVFSKLCNALWYIDHCHAKLENNGCPVPSAFKQFHGYNQYMKHHHTAPIVTSHKLNEHCIELSKCLSFPSMTAKPHAVLSKHMQALFH